VTSSSDRNRGEGFDNKVMVIFDQTMERIEITAIGLSEMSLKTLVSSIYDETLDSFAILARLAELSNGGRAEQ
jgi:hypothetical protein